MKTGIGTMLLVLLASVPATAQVTGTLSGKVTDIGRRPIQRAAVVVIGMTPLRGGVVKSDGSYLIAGIRAGEYNLKVTAVGYRTTIKEKVRISVDQTTTVNFVLAATDSTDKPSERTILPRTSLNHHPTFGNNGFSIRGGRPRTDRTGFNFDESIRPEARVTDPPPESIAAPGGAPVPNHRTTTMGLAHYRPAIAEARGRGSFVHQSATDDPFTGGFGGMNGRACLPYHYSLIQETIVRASPFDVARRDVVEPPAAERAEWIRGYEERRDQLSAYERQLASWSRRR